MSSIVTTQHVSRECQLPASSVNSRRGRLGDDLRPRFRRRDARARRRDGRVRALGQPGGPRRRAVAPRRAAAAARPSRIDDPPQKVGLRRTTSGSYAPRRPGRRRARPTTPSTSRSRSATSAPESPSSTAGTSCRRSSSARTMSPPPLEDFTTLTRDLYIAPGDVGFWQGALRDPGSDDYRKPARGRGPAADRRRHPLRRLRRRPARDQPLPALAARDRRRPALVRVRRPPLERRPARAARALALGASADAPTDGGEQRQLRRFFWSDRRGLSPAHFAITPRCSWSWGSSS